MKNKILILLFLLLPLSVYGDTVYVDAIKNTLGPQGGTFLTTKVQSGNFYELKVTNNSAVFNTASNDNAKCRCCVCSTSEEDDNSNNKC